MDNFGLPNGYGIIMGEYVSHYHAGETCLCQHIGKLDEKGIMEAVHKYDKVVTVLSETYDVIKKIDFSVQMWTKYDDIPWEAIENILGETDTV